MFAIFFMALAIAIPYFSQKVRRDRALTLSMAAVISVHQIVSVLQVALSGLPTLKLDPLSFNHYALTGEGRLEEDRYAQALHQIYTAFDGSHLLGCQISNILFSLALVVQVEIIYRMGYARQAPRLILLFGLLPSCVLNTSVVLREAGQVFLFLYLTLLLMEISQEGFQPRAVLILPVCWALTYLHQAMAVLLLLILPIAIAWAAKARPVFLITILVIALSGGALVKDRVLETLVQRSKALERLSSGDLNYIAEYATRVEEGRTDFGIRLDLSSVKGLLQTGPVLLVHYLFSPFPWQVRSLLDLYGLFECFLRLLLCFGVGIAFRKADSRQRNLLVLLCLMFITMETGWAAGTANWGTAFRHRVVAWGILVAAGGGAVLESRERNSTDEPSSPQPRTKKVSVRQRRRKLLARRREEESPANEP